MNGEVLRGVFSIVSCCCLTEILSVSPRVFIHYSLEEAIFLLCCLCSAGYNTFLIYDEVSKLHSKMNNNDSKRCITFFFLIFNTATFVLLLCWIFQLLYVGGRLVFCFFFFKQRITMKWKKKLQTKKKKKFKVCKKRKISPGCHCRKSRAGQN